MQMRRFLGMAAVAALLVGGAVGLRAQSATIMPTPFQTALDNSGAIINNACIWTYTAGTSTPVATYADSGLVTTNANPIRSDTAGRFTAFLVPGVSYKFVYETACTPPAHGTVLRTADTIGAVPTSAANVDVTGTAGESITAGQWVYLSDGTTTSAARTAGLWYKTDATYTAASTSALVVGIAPSAIASSASGTIRIAGSITSGTYATGTDYYLSASSAGAVTSTAPANIRKVGRASSTTAIVLVPNPPDSVTLNNTICDGRLTLTSGTAVTTADVTGATSIYWTPYKGNRIALYDSTHAVWNVRTFSELTLALGTLSSGLPYDVFAYDNAGTVALRSPVAWTNTTTRATALTLQDGVLVKTGATTDRYLGTFYTTSTTQTEDSAAKRFVWNYYNRQVRSMFRQDTTSTWTYNTATIRQANGSTANQLAFVVGVSENPIWCRVRTNMTMPAGTDAGVGIGLDSTTAAATGSIGSTNHSTTTDYVMQAEYIGYPGVGYHYLAWLEFGSGGTSNFNLLYVTLFTGGGMHGEIVN